MEIQLAEIPIRSVLHFLGWHGSALQTDWIDKISELTNRIKGELHPQVILRRFPVEPDGRLGGTVFSPQGTDVQKLLVNCREAVLLAATLGAESERLLFRAEMPQAFLLDAVLSAAIESVCDQTENEFREKVKGLYVTDRFSPGYGDMPLEQSREICEVLATDRTIGLTVSSSGIMIPRKSVTAILGVSEKPVMRRPRGCQACRADCPMREE